MEVDDENGCLFEGSPESLADDVLAMASQKEMRGRLVQIFSRLQDLQAKLDKWEQDAEEDFIIDKGDNNDDSVVEISEDAPISYSTVGHLEPLSSTEKTPKPETSSRNSCFNCGGPHMISECKEPKDYARIAAARRQQGGGAGPQARYHVDEKQKLAHVKPGLPSKRLRKALGIKDKRLPEYIYRMRELGYPPAWLRHAAVNHSGLSMYIDRDRIVTAEETTNGEDGELENDYDVRKVQYDADKLVEWPGFNVDIPKGFQDESRYYRYFQSSWDAGHSVPVLHERAHVSLRAQRVRARSDAGHQGRQR